MVEHIIWDYWDTTKVKTYATRRNYYMLQYINQNGFHVFFIFIF